jgi:hypothetical protein
MTLRTGKGSQYRYYTCSTKARQGVSGCRGLTVPMDKLDRAVADHLEWRLLDPSRLATLMDQLLARRDEWNEPGPPPVKSEAALRVDRFLARQATEMSCYPVA